MFLRQAFAKIVLTMLVLVALYGNARSDSLNISAEAVASAIQNYACFNRYYTSDNAAVERSYLLTFRTEGLWTYGWTEITESASGTVSFGNLHFGKLPGTGGRRAIFYALYEKYGRMIVAYSVGYDIEAMAGNMYFERNKQKVFDGKTNTVVFAEPSDCVPKFEESDIKNKMVDAVATSVARQLSAFNKHAGAKYPQYVKIIIANFNPDYPETIILLPIEDHMYTVRFHNGRDPNDDRGLVERDYPFGEIYNKDEISALRGKVLQYGISREIELKY